MISLPLYLLLGAFLFAAGLVVVITKKNAIVVLMGIELLLNAANLNLVAFSQYQADRLAGHTFALFVIVVAAAEAAVAMAIVLKVYTFYHTANVNEVHQLKG